LVYEEGIFKVEAISNLSIPQNSKTILAQKPWDNYGKNKNVIYKFSYDKL